MNIEVETYLLKNGFDYIAGIDEAGRGACAGPIVAAAVVFDESIKKKSILIDAIKESKKLTAKKREEFYRVIQQEAADVAIGQVEASEIDEITIGNANRLCILKALQNLKITPSFVMADFVQKLQFNIPFQIFKKGDDNIISIAAASIIAKVYRDRLMVGYAKQYPKYNFDAHKGYGTMSHTQALLRYGSCPIHRKTFALGKKK